MKLNERLECLSRALDSDSSTILFRSSAEVCLQDAHTLYAEARFGLADACAERTADYVWGRSVRPEGWDDE
jgi:hypothetical protein